MAAERQAQHALQELRRVQTLESDPTGAKILRKSLAAREPRVFPKTPIGRKVLGLEEALGLRFDERLGELALDGEQRSLAAVQNDVRIRRNPTEPRLEFLLEG